MAYLILTSKGRETGRRRLDGPLVIGRAPDCGLAVRDVLLSRHHCRIEPAGSGWVVVDLGSKNGTWLDGQRVGRRGLRYGEDLRVGKNTLRLMPGELPADAVGVPDASDTSGGSGVPVEPDRGRPTPSRPADPFEALAGTVAGAVFDFVDFESAGGRPAPARRPINRFPTPRPMPPEPAAYARDDIYSMLTEIASSSWDSIYANASRPTRPAPRVVLPTGTVPGTATPAAATARRPQRHRAARDQERANAGSSHGGPKWT